MSQPFVEQLMLKCFMQDKNYLANISNVFDKRYFDNVYISNIFEFVSNYFKTYNKIPSKDIIINSFTKDKDEYDEIFKEVETVDVDIIQSYDYIFNETNKYLKEKAVKQAILDSVNVIDKNEDYNKIRKLVENALIKDLKVDLGLNYFNDLECRLKRILTNSDVRIPTYFPVHDEYLNGGFPPYTFSVYIARIHGGKSCTLSNFATRQVLNGHNVALFSMEMSEDAFAQRFDSSFTGLDINRIYTSKTHTKKMIEKLKSIKKMKRGNLFIKQYPTGQACVNDFRMYLRELEMRGIKIDIIYCDYLNIMRPDDSSSGTDLYNKAKSIAEELRALSFEFKAPVVSVSQLNRIGSHLDLKLEDLDFVHISESHGVGATADFVGIYGKSEDVLLYEGEMHYKIVKNRLGGRVGTIDKFFIDTRSLKMYDSNELDVWVNDAKESGDKREMVQKTISSDEETIPKRRKKK